MDILEEIDKYLEALRKARKHAEKIGETIANALREVVPDIEYSIGWEEAGIDTICFWSNTKNTSHYIKDNADTLLANIIEEVFPELSGHIDTPYGVFLTKEEAEKARKILTELRHGKSTILSKPRQDRKQAKL